MAQVRHTGLARRDLLDIWLGIARHNPGAADRVYDRLEARVRILERYPRVGPARPDIASEARMLVERPYLILYRLIPEGVHIVRVLHGARDSDAAMFNQGIE